MTLHTPAPVGSVSLSGRWHRSYIGTTTPSPPPSILLCRCTKQYSVRCGLISSNELTDALPPAPISGTAGRSITSTIVTPRMRSVPRTSVNRQNPPSRRCTGLTRMLHSASPKRSNLLVLLLVESLSPPCTSMSVGEPGSRYRHRSPSCIGTRRRRCITSPSATVTAGG